MNRALAHAVILRSHSAFVRFSEVLSYTMTSELTFAILLGLVAVATALGFVWRAGNGRVRVSEAGDLVTASELPDAAGLGSGATLLQFSSEVCAPCVATRGVLGQIADERPEVSHVEVDVTISSALVTRFNILQTPTTLVLDSRGTVRARIGGAARRDAVLAELDRIVSPATTLV
jgi:thiol-disulfide isomerase/thioredoxin